jgi:hypothetical protein
MLANGTMRKLQALEGATVECAQGRRHVLGPTRPFTTSPIAPLDVLKRPIAIWLHSAMRPRFGAGPATAIITGVAVWTLVLPFR